MSLLGRRGRRNGFLSTYGSSASSRRRNQEDVLREMNERNERRRQEMEERVQGQISPQISAQRMTYQEISALMSQNTASLDPSVIRPTEIRMSDPYTISMPPREEMRLGLDEATGEWHEVPPQAMPPIDNISYGYQRVSSTWDAVSPEIAQNMTRLNEEMMREQTMRRDIALRKVRNLLEGIKNYPHYMVQDVKQELYQENTNDAAEDNNRRIIVENQRMSPEEMMNHLRYTDR